MPEGLKEKHTQFCEQLDQWRSWDCVECRGHGGSPTAERLCGHGNQEFNRDQVYNLLCLPKKYCDREGDAKTNPVKHLSGLVNYAALRSAFHVNINNRSSQKPGTEVGADLREGGVRYRVKLRKYVVEYRPSRFKWKLWMGTYSLLNEGRRAFDCAMFYAGQGRGNYYFPDSPELFSKLGPLSRPFLQVSKDARDKLFNIELKKRAKEVIKQTLPMRGMEPSPIQALKVDEPALEGSDHEDLDPKDIDPAFKDLEPLFSLHPLLYSDDLIYPNGSSSSDRSGSPFFVAGLNYVDLPKFVLDCESDESCNTDFPTWIYEIVTSPRALLKR